MNAYDIYEAENSTAILYYAIAENEEQVRQLAEQNGIDLTGMDIELERHNVKDQLGRPYTPSIKDAQVY